MCGIAGIVSRDAQVRAGARVGTMLARLVHRGPDDEGIASVAGATLGARRLSIIDLARGHQPMRSEDGSVIAVQNGEIYNFRELRDGLQARGHRFFTENDTEVLPHAYEEFGVDFVTRLRGMFALAVWDAARGRLILARDRLGKKPLVYARDGDDLFFASEIQALLALGEVRRTVDDTAVAEYLTYGYVPAPRTGFATIRKLEPGHILVFEDRSLRTSRYWSVRFEPKQSISFEDAAERLRAEIDEAVRVRLISDVPLGVLLSGGLDSSTVVAFMARHSERPVRTFSIGFREADFDELRYARLVARRFSTDHHELIVEPSAIDVLPVLVRHFGEPFADSSAIPTYYVARMARQHVTVVLNGDGGDELFGGYDRYRAVGVAALVDRMPWLGVGLSRLAQDLRPRFTSWRPVARVQRLCEALALQPDDRYFRWMAYFSARRWGRLYGDRLALVDPENGRFLASAADVATASDQVERAMAADLLTYLPGDLLVKMDIATMANSLEARSPFLDHHLVEFVSSLPRSYKMSIRRSKVLLRYAMRGILPPEILSRGKMGFGVPVGRWLRGPLRDMLYDTVLSTSALSRDYVRRDVATALIEEHLSGRADRTPLVWALLMLELWFRYCVRVSGEDVPSRAPVAKERWSILP